MTYECYCDYDDQPEWHDERRIKAARKPHDCEECHTVIREGTPYTRVSGKWDGQVHTFAICPLCQELLEWAKISVPCFCWACGNLHQDVADMVDQVAPDVPGFDDEYRERMAAIRQAKAAAFKVNGVPA